MKLFGNTGNITRDDKRAQFFKSATTTHVRQSNVSSSQYQILTGHCPMTGHNLTDETECCSKKINRWPMQIITSSKRSIRRTELHVFKATFPLGAPPWDPLLYLHSSSSRHQRPKSPIIAKNGWDVMRFKPHNTALFSCVHNSNNALTPMSDKLEFQLASISLRSGMFLAKLLSVVSVRLLTPAMFNIEMRWQFAARVFIVKWEAAHWRKLRCWREEQLFAMVVMPRSEISSHHDTSKYFNWWKKTKPFSCVLYSRTPL